MLFYGQGGGGQRGFEEEEKRERWKGEKNMKRVKRRENWAFL